ncbi:hypothetical protein [Kaistia algarum]|nr:hypothetical protein [Kaistia algarum]MCX5515362.1 hypothetical protein [Kaistia algarum]
MAASAIPMWLYRRAAAARGAVFFGMAKSVQAPQIGPAQSYQ